MHNKIKIFLVLSDFIIQNYSIINYFLSIIYNIFLIIKKILIIFMV